MFNIRKIKSIYLSMVHNSSSGLMLFMNISKLDVPVLVNPGFSTLVNMSTPVNQVWKWSRLYAHLWCLSNYRQTPPQDIFSTVYYRQEVGCYLSTRDLRLTWFKTNPRQIDEFCKNWSMPLLSGIDVVVMLRSSMPFDLTAMLTKKANVWLRWYRQLLCPSPSDAS